MTKRIREGKIRYGARQMDGGKWGIVVDIWHKDGNTTRDRNTTPWPTEASAVVASWNAAQSVADQEDIEDVQAYVTNKGLD
jgi:hypothetical protein